LYYNDYMKVYHQDTVVVTSSGNIVVHAGDITEEKTDDETLKVRSIGGYRPKLIPKEWEYGRPLEVIAGEKKILVTRSRLRQTFGNMDVVLPREVLARRKALVKARMKEERE